MPITTPLDYLPLWLLIICMAVGVSLCVEAGYRLGRYRGQLPERETEAPVGTMVGATLGLLAFMLAFTFGLAASRFEDRRQLVVEEANAIGTTYLRAGLLPQQQAGKVRQWLSSYVDSRLEAVRTGDPEIALRRADELHPQLWNEAEIAARGQGDSVAVGLFVQALNETIDVHARRVLVGLQSRLPPPLWVALFLLTGLAMAGVGYQEGIAKSRRSPALLVLVLTFSIIMALIADLDRPQQGFLSVSQNAMVKLQETFEKYP
jgi:hypothetical protein